MPAQAEKHVPGLAVLVDGSEINPRYRDLLVEVRVRGTLALPDSAVLRINDPTGGQVDEVMGVFGIGKDLEVKISPPAENTKTRIFKGQVVALEPDFGKEGAEIVIRGLDKGHKLQRQRKVRTFQQVSAADIVKKLGGDVGLSVDAESTSVVHEFFQQSAETDWELISRLARAEDYRFFVDDNKLVFRDAATAPEAAVALKWQETLQSFRPRVSGVQQVQTINMRSWDPKAKQVVNGSATSDTTTSRPGIQRGSVSLDLGGGTTLVADRVATDSGEANAIAKSALGSRADAFVEAEGVAFGNPDIKAGRKVDISGVGTKLSGTFIVSSATHLYKGASGYSTSFQISGRSERGLLDLMHPPQKHDWSRHLVIGVVTNNNDPDETGRVRVKYPSLSDSEESAWARVASMSAGNARGLMMLPQPDEEVIVGFEQGDTRRPIVLGSLFNGKDKPGPDLLQNRDGSFALLSNEKGLLHTKKDLEIKSDQKMIVEIQSDQEIKVQGNAKQETTGNGSMKAQQLTVEAGSTLSVKGVSVTVEATASLTLKGATVDVQASGPLNLKGAIINIG